MILEKQSTFPLPDVKSFKGSKFKSKNFYCLGSNFRNNFLGKNEAKITGGQFKLSNLTQYSVDGPIIDELGGQDKAEVSLAHLWEFLKTADKHGWYLAYVRDLKGELWAVYCRWRAIGGSNVEAYPFTNPFAWVAGIQVLSRDSEPSETLPSQALENSGSLTAEEIKKLKRLCEVLG